MTGVALILRKDLRVLLRSPLLLAVLIVYPLLVAGLVGLVAGYGSSNVERSVSAAATGSSSPSRRAKSSRFSRVVRRS